MKQLIGTIKGIDVYQDTLATPGQLYFLNDNYRDQYLPYNDAPRLLRLKAWLIRKLHI